MSSQLAAALATLATIAISTGGSKISCVCRCFCSVMKAMYGGTPHASFALNAAADAESAGSCRMPSKIGSAHARIAMNGTPSASIRSVPSVAHRP